MILLGANLANAQGAGYHIVHSESSTLGNGKGAFASVCIDHVEGLSFLKQRAGEFKRGIGVNQSFSYAAESLYYFGMPVLVTSECLDKMTAQYAFYYKRNDLVVVDLK